eukprot:TRINITY_DN13190_c0_g1_i3.p2 TRINITY_DN13190_c0_g1~~TRINITY_DN13190_c0_g1_i3.p2  ORF type:complete len:108 (+),score=47.80 TRINITY_DN13190_c0_g1_i3:123-446(+)
MCIRDREVKWPAGVVMAGGEAEGNVLEPEEDNGGGCEHVPAQDTELSGAELKRLQMIESSLGRIEGKVECVTERVSTSVRLERIEERVASMEGKLDDVLALLKARDV